MNDLQALINEQAQKVIEEKLPEMVSKHLSQSIDSCINSLLNYGNSEKNLKLKIQECLDVAIEKIQLDKYNILISNMIEKSVGNFLSENALSVLQDRINKFLSPLEKMEWKISEIIKLFSTHYFEENGDEDYFEPTIIIEKKESFEYCYLDFKSNEDWYQTKYRIYTYKGKVSSVEINGSDGMSVYHSEFDRLLQSLWTNEARVEMDDNYYTEFERHSY